MMMEQRNNTVREQYAKWLQGYRWDYFLTSTFRSPRHEPYYAIKHVWHELHDGHNIARAFLVAEPHQSGDLHIHGITAGSKLEPFAGVEPRGYYGVQGNNIDTPAGTWEGLFKRFGRAKVEPCNSHEAVSMYCAKYLLKQQHRACDYYEIFGNKYAWERGRM